MSQRVKRPNRSEDGSVPVKRRKRTTAEEEEAASLAASQGSWQPPRTNELKTIYNRSTTEAPAELFRKDLISAMKLPDSEPLTQDEYWVIVDQWKQEWERGVQVPVNPDSLPEPSVTIAKNRPARSHKDFKLPKNKYIRINKDDNFDVEAHSFSNAPAQSEAACSYDLDESDVSWLKILNAERASSGLSPIYDDQLERVIERLELCCWEKIQSILKNEEGLGIEYDENVICDVCRSPDSEDGNEMVFCDSCNICVHQACYGITKIPEGQWLCCTCNLRKRPDCMLCPNKGGAMKSTRTGQKWAHVSCSLWIPEVSIGCVEKMEPITKISSIPASRWALICVLCRERRGACIQCSVKTCKTAYHVTCAFKHGLEMRAIIEDENADDGVKLRSYCEKHSKSSKKSEKSVCSGGSEESDTRRRKRKEMTSEEKNQARAARLQEIESEFFKHVSVKDINMHIEVDTDGLQYIYNYWKLKRRAGHNKPLLPPKSEDVDVLSHKREQADLEKMKMFVQLRQDLERVRNLCYMVSRREKLSRSFFRMREQTFHKQAAVLESSNTLPTTVIQAVIEANHGPSIYDRLYSHDEAEDHTSDFDVILARIAGLKSPSHSGEDLKPGDVNGLFRDVKNNPYKKVYFNGSSKRRSASLYGSSLSSASSSDEKPKDDKENQVRSSSGEEKPDKKRSTPKKQTRKRRILSRSKVESSSEDEKPIITPKSESRSRLGQVAKELGDTGSESDDLLPMKSSKSKKIMSSIYSDSESSDVSMKNDDKSSNATNDSQSKLRTKAAVKEFSKPGSSKSANKVNADQVRKKLKLEEGTKKDYVQSDLIVPQRQAAKKASENLKSTNRSKDQHAVPNSSEETKPEEREKEKDKEKKEVKVAKPKGKTHIAKDKEEEKKTKEPEPIKKKELEPIKKKEPEPIKKKEPEPIKKKEPEPIKKKEPEPIKKKEPEPIKKKEPDQASKEADAQKEADLFAFVPQRQAAKKAAEHIKSGMGKTPTADNSQAVAGEAKKDSPDISKATSNAKPKKESEPAKIPSKRKSSAQSSTSSSTSSSSSSDSGSSSSSDSESEVEKEKEKEKEMEKEMEKEKERERETEKKKSPSAPQPRSESHAATRRSSRAEDWPFLDKGARPRAASSSSASSSSSGSDSSDSSRTSVKKSTGKSASPAASRKPSDSPDRKKSPRKSSPAVAGRRTVSPAKRKSSPAASRKRTPSPTVKKSSDSGQQKAVAADQPAATARARKPSADKRLPSKREEPPRRGRGRARGRPRRTSHSTSDRVGDVDVRSRDLPDDEPVSVEGELSPVKRKSDISPSHTSNRRDKGSPSTELLPTIGKTDQKLKKEKLSPEKVDLEQEIRERKAGKEKEGVNKSKSALDKLFRASAKSNSGKEKKQQDKIKNNRRSEGSEPIIKSPNKELKEQIERKNRLTVEEPLPVETKNDHKTKPLPEVKERKPEVKERKPEEKERKSEAEESKPEVNEIKPEVKERKPEVKERKPEVKERKPEAKETMTNIELPMVETKKGKEKHFTDTMHSRRSKSKDRENLLGEALFDKNKSTAKDMDEAVCNSRLNETSIDVEAALTNKFDLTKMPSSEISTVEKVDEILTTRHDSDNRSEKHHDFFTDSITHENSDVDMLLSSSESKENISESLSNKNLKVIDEISTADKIVDDHLQSQKLKEQEKHNLDIAKPESNEYDQETTNATQSLEALESKSIFSPPHQQSKETDILDLVQFDDSFGLSKDEPVKESVPNNSSVKEDTKEDSARETLNLIEKLRMGLNKKSTSGDTDDTTTSDAAEFNKGENMEQVVPNNIIPPAAIPEIPSILTKFENHIPDDIVKSTFNQQFALPNCTMDATKNMFLQPPEELIHPAPLQGDERWVPPSTQYPYANDALAQYQKELSQEPVGLLNSLNKSLLKERSLTPSNDPRISQTPLPLECMPSPSPYPDIHPQAKWADSAIMPSRRSSVSSSSGCSSKREEDESAKMPHDIRIGSGGLDMAPFMPYPQNHLDNMGQFQDPSFATVSLFPPTTLNTQFSPAASTGVFPPAHTGLELKSHCAAFGPPFPTTASSISSMTKPVEDSVPYSAAFTSSQHNMALTAAMVNLTTSLGPVPEKEMPPPPPGGTVEAVQQTSPVLSSESTLPSPSTTSSAKNSVGKKSPTKPTRTSARVTSQMMNKSPAKSPGKSPRQESFQKQSGPGRGRGESKRGSGKSGLSKTQVTSRGRGRGRGRGRHHNDYDFMGANTIHNRLVGTVYDLDFDDDISNDTMTIDLKSMRERRKSIDVHEKKFDSFSSPRSPRFASPKNRFSTDHLRDLKPPSPREDRGKTNASVNSVPPIAFPEVAPVLPGPVDMRTYNSDATSRFDQTSLNEQNLLSAFASGTAGARVNEELDEDFEKELHSALSTKKVEELPISEVASNHSSNIKVSLSDSRNQLKVKIKGPIANYNCPIPPLPAPILDVVPNNTTSSSINAVGNISIGMSSGGTSSLRRMRKKELLRQYWTQDMNMDDPSSNSSFTSMPPVAPINRTIITIPKAIASMTSIPTKEDYRDYRNDDFIETKHHKKSKGLSRELKQLDMTFDDLGDRRRTTTNVSVVEAPKHKIRGRAARNATAAPAQAVPAPTAPKLKIKIGSTGNNSVVSEEKSEEKNLRPPKKRHNIAKPSLEDLKRDSMNFRKQMMADLKVRKKKKDKNDKHKKKDRKNSDPKVQIISDDSTSTKLIFRFVKPKVANEVRLSNEVRTSESKSDQVDDRTKHTPIKLKISRCGEGSGYMMKPTTVPEPECARTKEDQTSEPGEPPPEPAPAEPDPLEGLPEALQQEPPPPPLNKDCEVR